MAELVTEFINGDFEEWKIALLIGWRKNERATAPEFGAKIDRRKRFASLVPCWRPPKALRLTPEHIGDEIYLPEAFNFEIDRDGTYVKIPSQILSAVEGKMA